MVDIDWESDRIWEAVPEMSQNSNIIQLGYDSSRNLGKLVQYAKVHMYVSMYIYTISCKHICMRFKIEGL